ncbi:lysophospholipid acyltransferase family protein [Limibacter armeniacum]|uniref:lysophospholipid acyltransferase family protein n=1 Tax=Limibacter armeniacum TaxID=466084 RepID=UPI002FE50B32
MSRKKGLKKLKYDVLYVVIKAMIDMICFMPRKSMIRLGGAIGKLVYAVMSGEREKTIRNLTIAYGNEKSPEEIKKMAKKVWENIGKNAIDIIRYRNIQNLEDYKKIVKIEGVENLEAAYNSGKGVVGLVPHLGAFEMVGTMPFEMGYTVTIVGAALKDPRMNQLLVGNRTLRGAKYVERGQSTIKLVKALKSGEIVFLLIDQDTQKVQNVFVDFYGKKAATPIGATMLAQRTGALVLPMAIRRMEDDTHLLTIKPAVELKTTGDQEKDMVNNTQILSNYLEDFIREAPEQWVWMHERWKTRPEEELVS